VFIYLVVVVVAGEEAAGGANSCPEHHIQISIKTCI